MMAALLAVAIVAAPVDGQHPQPPVAPGGYAYQRYLPKGYGTDAKTRWPLMIFLHGSGERGSDLDRVKVHGPPKIADRNPAFPFVLVSPQLPADQGWDLAKLSTLLDHSIATLRIDPARIYLTGLSLGGHATWRWAAAVPPEGSFAMVRAIRGCGGQPRLTIYPDLGHNSWDPAYDDAKFYAWLLAQRRPAPPIKDKK